MNPAKLNRRITFQTKTAGRDSAGQPLLTWDSNETVWASIINKNGLQALKAGADVSINQTSIRTRYITGKTAGMRIVYGAIVYDIKAVLPDSEGKQFVDFLCESGANDG